MENASTRDMLETLAQSPIGSRELQASPALDETGHVRPEVKEAAQRASKIWLPQGKRATNTREARAVREQFKQAQTDIEDAVEAAGGKRGA